MQSSITLQIAAGVVAFGPDRRLIIPLVRSVLSDVACVFVFVNAIIDGDLRKELDNIGPRCRVLYSEYNLGVAEALNQIAYHASQQGCTRVVLFDQDSRPPAGMVGRLSTIMDQLIQAGENVAALGPQIVAPSGRAHEFKSPRYFPTPQRTRLMEAVPVHYIITSGSLIDLAALQQIGPFRSDFFIDAIDTEWCFRAWAKGWSCWFAPQQPMEHTIGEGAIRSRLFGIRFPHQSPMRMYSYFRNQVASLLLPHIPLRWKLKFGLHLTFLAFSIIIHSGFTPSTAWHITRAIRDGLTGRLGPPPGAAHCAPSQKLP